MSAESIEAYNLAGRVAAYDRDMQIMHPLRSRMVDVAIEVLPFPRDAPLLALDLGVRTGFSMRSRMPACLPSTALPR